MMCGTDRPKGGSCQTPINEATTRETFGMKRPLTDDENGVGERASHDDQWVVERLRRGWRQNGYS